jgi:hypothetical protein
MSKPALPPAVLSVLAVLLAGCASPAAEPEPPADAASSDGPPVPVPVSLDGTLTARASVFDTGVAGPLSRIDLTLTWEAASPLTEEMYLTAFACKVPCESAEDVGEHVIASGPSPVVFDLHDFPLAADQTLYVKVDSKGLVPLFYATVATDQPFHVEGTLTPGPAPAE